MSGFQKFFPLLPSKIERVGIFGFGESGRAAFKLLGSVGVPSIVFDENKGEIFNEKKSLGCKVIVLSPGFSQMHPWVQVAKKMRCLLISELDLASFLWKGSLIAVTGTNGKSTLVAFLAQALKALGKEVFACGNSNIPFSTIALNEHTRSSIAVCEVSSFQAEAIKYFSPHALLWTNLTEDHLDRHLTMENYLKAKWNLVTQLKKKGLFIKGTKIPCQAQVKIHPTAKVFTLGLGEVKRIGEKLATKSLFKSVPQNENFSLAYTYFEAEGYDKAILLKVANRFKALPHRLERVTEFRNINFWNDSKATNFGSVLEALRRFEKPVYWIGGGKLKGGDIENFVKGVLPYVRTVFLIGESGPILQRLFLARGHRAFYCENLESAIKKALKESKNSVNNVSDIVFSPGFSSLDCYANFQARGNNFKKIVLRLKTQSK